MSLTPLRPVRARRRGLAGAALAAVTAVLLAGCGGSAEPAGGQADPAAAGFPRTITHAMGTTEVPAPPAAIAAMDSSFVDAAVAIGQPVSAWTRFPAAGGAVPDYYTPEQRALLEGGREVGSLASPDVEALFDVAPGLVVSAKVRHEALYDQFSSVGPTVFTETTGGDWKANMRLLGQATGREQAVEAAITQYEARAQRIGDAIRAKLGRNPTVSLVRFVAGEPTVRLTTTNSFAGSVVLQDVGLARPAGQPDTAGRVTDNISQEQITVLDADQIFVSSFSDGVSQSQDARAVFEANPLWGTLGGQRVEVNDTTFYTSVSILGAQRTLDDLATTYGVDPR